MASGPTRTRGADDVNLASPSFAEFPTTPSLRHTVLSALLLTGGASRRMGRDKSQLLLEGRTLAQRTASLLELVVEVAIEVGPGRSGLCHVDEEPRGQGPLGAIAAGRRALLERGYEGPSLVVACDMPLLSQDLLEYLVAFDAAGSVVPVVEGRAQPLCAKWGRADLDNAAELFAHGERSLRYLDTAPDVILLQESQWSAFACGATFSDVDTPEEARRLGITV